MSTRLTERGETVLLLLTAAALGLLLSALAGGWGGILG